MFMFVQILAGKYLNRRLQSKTPIPSVTCKAQWLCSHLRYLLAAQCLQKVNCEVTVLPAVANCNYTVTVQSLCSHCLVRTDGILLQNCQLVDVSCILRDMMSLSDVSCIQCCQKLQRAKLRPVFPTCTSKRLQKSS